MWQLRQLDSSIPGFVDTVFALGALHLFNNFIGLILFSVSFVLCVHTSLVHQRSGQPVIKWDSLPCLARGLLPTFTTSALCVGSCLQHPARPFTAVPSPAFPARPSCLSGNDSSLKIWFLETSSPLYALQGPPGCWFSQ